MLNGLSENPSIRFPEWVVRKEGTPIFTKNFFRSPVGFQDGTFIDGGAPALAVNTNHFWGENDNKEPTKNSIVMTTGAAPSSNSEYKMNIPWFQSGLIALELKWGFETVISGGTKFHMGIEPRLNKSDGFWQGRLRYTVSTDLWELETGIDTYTRFDALPFPRSGQKNVVIDRPDLDTAVGQAGDIWSWVRLVIDATKKEYVLAEFASDDVEGGIMSRDIRGIPLVTRGAATRPNLLCFCIAQAGAASAETMFMTDWCLSKL